MGLIKTGMNALAFGFTLIFAASVIEGGWFNPPRTGPLSLKKLTRALLAPNPATSKKSPQTKLPKGNSKVSPELD